MGAATAKKRTKKNPTLSEAVKKILLPASVQHKCLLL
jgi:hypothetical protein